MYTSFSSLDYQSRAQPGRVAQSVGPLIVKSEVLGSLPGLATYFRFCFRWFKRGSCQLLACVHEVQVYRLGGLSLPRKTAVRLTDRPDMALEVYRGRKTTIQQQQSKARKIDHPAPPVFWMRS